MDEINIHQNRDDKKELAMPLSERRTTWVTLSDDELRRAYPRMLLYRNRTPAGRADMSLLLTFNEFDELAVFVAELRRREIVGGGR